jgi:hypothetical protein
MNSQEFHKLTQPLLRWKKSADREVLKKQAKLCEDCGDMVVDRVVHCSAYRLNSPAPYFKHECKSCKRILFDGKNFAEAQVKKRKYNKKT